MYGPKPNGSGAFIVRATARARTTRTSPPTATGAAQGTRHPSCSPSRGPTTTASTWSGPGRRGVGARLHVQRQGRASGPTATRPRRTSAASTSAGRSSAAIPRAAPSRSCSPTRPTAARPGRSPTRSRPRTTAGSAAGRAARFAAARTATVYLQWEDTDKPVRSRRSQPRLTAAQTLLEAVDDRERHATSPPRSRDRTSATDSFASIAVDQTSGAVYVAWADAASGPARSSSTRARTARLRGRTSYTSGGTEGYRFYQGLDVAPNGRIDLGYQALTATSTTTIGTGNAKVASYYVGSTTGGTTLGVAVEGKRRLRSRCVRAERPRRSSSGATTTRSSRRTRRRGSSTPTPGTVSAARRSMPTRRAPGRSRRPRTVPEPVREHGRLRLEDHSVTRVCRPRAWRKPGRGSRH